MEARAWSAKAGRARHSSKACHGDHSSTVGHSSTAGRGDHNSTVRRSD
jgi:hypothetical protein